VGRSRLLYVNAYRQRHKLELTSWETYVTRLSAVQHLSISGFGLLSAAVSYLVPAPFTAPVAGCAYFLIFIPQVFFGRFRSRARQRFPAEPCPERSAGSGLAPRLLSWLHGDVLPWRSTSRTAARARGRS